MDRIDRNPELAAKTPYDLIIIGGGIQGACLLLESARHGLRSLLLERADFGGATSWNSLRIIHGGLRYLQRLDFRRARESFREQQWFFRHFPELVRPVGCLMPLYGNGMRRPAAFRLALAVNGMLAAFGRRHQTASVPRGRVLGAEETIRLVPGIVRAGLRGAGLWYDGSIVSSERLLIEILRWGCRYGGRALNYVEVRRLLGQGRTVAGVQAWDRRSEAVLEFRAPVVVNCGGPWCRRIATAFDRDVPWLFRPSLAFNVLLDRTPPSEVAVAVTPGRRQARSYFLVPRKGRVLAGTYHLPWSGPLEGARPSEEHIEAFLADLNGALPELNVSSANIVRVHAGLVPATETGSPDATARDVVFDHSRFGGTRGLFSISGSKFTTARAVAERTLRTIFAPKWGNLPGAAEMIPPLTWQRRGLEDSLGLGTAPFHTLAGHIKQLAADEAVVHLEDLLFRRTEWNFDSAETETLAAMVSGLLDRDAAGAELTLT